MEPALQEAPLPKYIAIEGPIGVGKTTLAHKIAETFNYDVFLEQPAENPALLLYYTWSGVLPKLIEQTRTPSVFLS